MGQAGLFAARVPARGSLKCVAVDAGYTFWPIFNRFCCPEANFWPIFEMRASKTSDRPHLYCLVYSK